MDFEYALIGSSSVGGAVLASFDALRRKKSMGTESQSGAENVEADASKGMGGLEKPANLLVIGGSVVGILLAFARAIDGQSDAGILLMLVCQLASITVAGLLTKRQDWRLALRATAFFTVAAAIAVLNGVIQTSLVHRIELASILSGIALLVIGHIAWYREGEHHDSAATFCLWCGSLLTAVPLGLGLLAYRSFEVPVSEMGWMFFHEIAAIVVALALAALGCSCRIRSTALAGASLLATYALSLLLIVRWPSQLRSVSLVMMVGGGLFFLTAVLLSVYRDRLVGIHSDMREKRGVFRVLRWR